MGKDNDFNRFQSGYNEGFFFAAQAVASAAIRLINNHPTWMLDPSRKQAIAEIKLATKHTSRRMQRADMQPAYERLRGPALGHVDAPAYIP